MKDDDSSWKTWHPRIAVIAGLATILGFFIVLPKNVRDLAREVFSKKPAPSVALPPGKQDAGVQPDRPDTKSSERPSLPHKVSSSPEDDFIRQYVAEDGQPHRIEAWTVVISAAGRDNFPELHAAAERVLSEKGYAVKPLFRAALLQDSAAYDELYAGNPALLKRIGSYRDGVLIGKLRSEVSQNSSLDMFTAHLFVDLRVISARPAKMEAQFTIDETGAGFSEAAATTAAEHRMAEKLKQQLLQSIPSK